MSVVIEEEALDDLDFRSSATKAERAAPLEWVVSESSHVIVYSLDHTRDVLAIIGVFRFSQENRRP